MKALVYDGPGERSWESIADPTIRDPGDVVVRIDSTTICGLQGARSRVFPQGAAVRERGARSRRGAPGAMEVALLLRSVGVRIA